MRVRENAKSRLGWSRNAIAMVATLLALYTASALYQPPSMYSDSGWGFLHGRSWTQGTALYERIQPSRENVSLDEKVTSVTWAPGQFVIPMLIQRLGFDLGRAIALCVALSSLLGICGYGLLFRRLGFGDGLVAASLLVIAAQRFFVLPFSIYNGGEVLVFAFTPWFYLAALTKSGIRTMCALLLLAFAGVFLKLSFFITFACVMVYVWLRGALPTTGQPQKGAALASAAGYASLVGASYLALQVFYLSRGTHAARLAPEVSLTKAVTGFLFAGASSGWASLSLGSLAERLWMYPGNEIWASWEEGWPLLIVSSALSALLLRMLWRNTKLSREYKLLSTAVVSSHVVVYALLFAFSQGVSLQERRMLGASILLLPGMLHVLMTARKPMAAFGFGVVLLSCCYGVTSHVVRFRAARASGAVGALGFSHLVIDRDALQALHRLDAASFTEPPLIYVTSPEIALELEHSRGFVRHADFVALEVLQTDRYRGRASDTFVMLPERFDANGKTTAILNAFVDYPRDAWRRRCAGGMVLYGQAQSQRSLQGTGWRPCG